MIPLAILCGGLGTRLGERTRDVPKPLVPVAGVPFLDHLLASVARSGVADVVLVVGYLGERIAAHVGDGARFGLRVRYADDGAVRRGTAGAVRNALPLLGERFLVSFGDALLDVDYAAVAAAAAASGCAGLMTVYPARSSERGNAEVRGARVVRYDKEAAPGELTYVDYGVSAFTARSFADLPTDPTDLTVVNGRLIAADSLAAYPMPSAPYEMGSPDGLRAMETYLARNA